MEFATKPYKLLENGKLLFRSWEAAVAYIEQFNLRNFRLERKPDGAAELTINCTAEGGSGAG